MRERGRGLDLGEKRGDMYFVKDFFFYRSNQSFIIKPLEVFYILRQLKR